MIREHDVDIETPEGDLTIENDRVLAMTGYQPNLVFLRNMGILLSEDNMMSPLIDEHTHETNVKNIFLAGVICGGMNTHRLFIENSREHAKKIIQAIRERSGMNG
jgi:thioredoxin reductase (NADPH)